MHGLAAQLSLRGEASVFEPLDRRLLKDCPPPLVVGLSGGGDSLALLRLTAAWAARARRPVLALCVDHGLSPEGAAWTRFAASKAAESGAAFAPLAWTGPKPTSGIPAAARAARHALLARAAREAGASVVLLGHTADDVAETEHMRGGDAPGIGRLREWSPSPAWPQGGGIMLLRPMLGVRRADIRAWLRARGDAWIDDPANADPRFARVRARAATASCPAEPIIETSNFEAGVRAQAERFEGAGEGGLRLPLDALADAPSAAVLHSLSTAVLCAGGGSVPPRRAKVERLLARLKAAAPASTLCGARIELRGGFVRFTREAGDRARNPRPDVDGVVDGRFLRRPDGPHWLPFDRLRAACFLVERETPPSDPAAASGRLPAHAAVA